MDRTEWNAANSGVGAVRRSAGGATVEKTQLGDFDPFTFTALIEPAMIKVTKAGDLIYGFKVPKQYKDKFEQIIDVLGIPLTVTVERWRNTRAQNVDDV